MSVTKCQLLSELCPLNGRWVLATRDRDSVQYGEVLRPPWPFPSPSQLSGPRPRSLERLGDRRKGLGACVWLSDGSFLCRRKLLPLQGDGSHSTLRGASCPCLSRGHVFGGKKGSGVPGTSFQVQRVLLLQYCSLPGSHGTPLSSPRCPVSAPSLAPGGSVTIFLRWVPAAFLGCRFWGPCLPHIWG